MQRINLGSTRRWRVAFGGSPNDPRKSVLKGREGGPPSPAREPRALPRLRSCAESRRHQFFGAAGDDQFLRGGTERREGE